LIKPYKNSDCFYIMFDWRCGIYNKIYKNILSLYIVCLRKIVSFKKVIFFWKIIFKKIGFLKNGLSFYV